MKVHNILLLSLVSFFGDIIVKCDVGNFRDP